MKLPTIFSFLIALFVIGSEVKSHSPHDNVHVVAFSPNYALDQVIFCSLSHRNHFVLRSENGGKSWSPSQRGIPHSDVVCLAISPDYDPQNGVVFAGTRRKGLFRSADGGRSWTSTTDPIRIATIAISPDFAIDQVV